MKHEWTKVKFGDVVEFPPKIKMQKGKIYPFIPMENLDSGIKYVKPLTEKQLSGSGAKFEERDTLFARITPCLENGKIAQAKDLNNKPGFGSTEFFVYRGKENKTDSDFVYYLSKTQWFQQNAINSMVGASGRQRADAGFLRNLKVNIPALNTQRKIASILSTYDDLIENNIKRIKLLEEKAQLIYEEWFVRFKFPGYESTSINQETGLPEGWEFIKVGELLSKVKSTKKIKSSEIREEGKIPVIDQSQTFIKGYTNCDEALIEIEKPIIIFGDHTRILKLINFPFARGADGTQLILSNNKRMPQHLFYFTLLGVELSNYHYARHFKFLKDSEIILPEFNISNKFEKIVEVNFKTILNLQNQNFLLQKARDILLPRLMTGMIDVEQISIKESLEKVQY